MQSYTEKPTKPATVQAVQYTAPNGDDVAGNLAEIKDAAADVREQSPWNPAGGQHSLIVVNSAGTELLEDGGYLVVDANGEARVYTEDDLHAKFDLVAEPKVNVDTKN